MDQQPGEDHQHHPQPGLPTEERRVSLFKIKFYLCSAVKTKSLHPTVSWIISCMRKVDKNHDNKMSLKEVKDFMRQINVEVDDYYAEDLFNVSFSSKIV